MKKLLLFIALLGICTTISAQQKQPQAIIFETDMGNDIDDAMALDILFKNMDQGNINLLGIGVHKNNPHSAEYIDIMRVWYGYKNIPIGVNAKWITDLNCNDYCTKVCKMTNSDGKPLFERSKNPKYEDAVEMYRRLLSKQEDGSVVIVTVGFSTTIAELLQSKPDKYSKLSGMELVAKKVKYFSVMAGEFVQANMKEYNVWNDLIATKYFFDKSPVPMVITPWILGNQVVYPGKSIAEDFNWGKPHPMVEGYKSYLKMPYDRQTWDVIAAYYACHPDHDAFTLGEPGEVKVVDQGKTVFTPKADGRFRILVPSEQQREKILNYFKETLTTKPKNF